MSKTIKVVHPYYETGPFRVLSGAEMYITDVAEVQVFRPETHCFVIESSGEGDEKIEHMIVVGTAEWKDEQASPAAREQNTPHIGVAAFRMYCGCTAERVKEAQERGKPILCTYMTIRKADGSSDFLALDEGHQAFLLGENGDTMCRLTAR